jgi:glycosyltransferase involved in cell wall biosynthesis
MMNISAIIPVYNGEKYLHEAVNSVIQQTLQPIELILVDDGSTDNSIREIADIEANFPIRILNQKNAGQSAARNYGAREAKGDYIAFLDQDDVWYNQHLEKLSRLFCENTDLGFVYSNVDYADANGNAFRFRILNLCPFSHPHADIIEMIRYDMHILPSAALIRKKAFFDVGMFDERLCGYEDDDLFLRLYIKGWKCKYIEDSLSKWRIHPNNTGTKNAFKSRSIYADKIINTFSINNPCMHFIAAELIGKRFFEITQSIYLENLAYGDYEKCKVLYEDIRKYFDLAPSSYQNPLKCKVLLMQYPKLFKLIKTVKRFLKL